jgi:hypothetical protein
MFHVEHLSHPKYGGAFYINDLRRLAGKTAFVLPVHQERDFAPLHKPDDPYESLGYTKD